MRDIVNVILWAALIQGLFLASLFIFSKKNRSFANFLLGMFLISIILEAINTILPFNAIGNYSISDYFSLLEVKLFIPVFFMHFVLEKLGSSSKYSWFLKINYVIAFLISGITLINLYLFIFNSSSIAKEMDYYITDRVHLWLQVYAFMITVCAFVIALKETLRYRSLVRNEFTDFTMLKINWLWQFIFMLLPATILWGVEIARIMITGYSQYDFVLIIWGFIALFLYFLSYKAYKHQNLFEKFPESILSGESVKSIGRKEHNCSTENSEIIKSLMRENEYFLNQHLTIHFFAREIEMSPRLISSCVNKNIGLNFNEWVNHYRVEKALEIINSDVQKRLSIEGVGYDCGFKSRSAMYAAFKKKLGHSPGYYQKN